MTLPSSRRGVLAVAGLTALAALVRLAWLGSTLTDDPPYHFLRVQRLLTDAPATTAADPLVAHPFGAVAVWPWGFDWLLAAIARPFAGHAPDLDAVVRATSPAVALLGAALVPLAYLLARALAGRGTALFAAALLVALPGHVDYSAACRVDHHVLEPLFLVLALLGPARARSRRGLILSGLAAGLSFAFVPVALTIAAPSVALMGAALVWRRNGDAAWYGLAAALGTALALLASPHPLAWVFYSPSLLQLSTMVAVAGGLAVAARLAARSGASPARALVGGALAGAGLLAAVAVAAPGFLRDLVAGLEYVRSNDFTALANESAPALADPWFLPVHLTWLFPLALPGAAAMLAARGAPVRRAAGALTVVAAVLALGQLRFVMLFTPLYALAVAEGAALAWRLAREALARRGVRPPVSRVLAGALVAAAWAQPVEYLLSVGAPGPVGATMIEAARWLRGRPPGGVLAPWSYGHVFQAWAGAPTVCDNFFGVPESDAALRACFALLYETDPARAARRLEEYRVRYVVLVPPGPAVVIADARMAGEDPSRFISPSGEVTRALASTFWVRAGLWAREAERGARGPFGLTLLRHWVVRDPESGRAAADVLLLERAP